MKNVIIITLLAIMLFFSVKTGIEKVEKAECEKWELQAGQYQGFYYTEWQADQCGI